ncbi:MAG: hypothetical protein M3N53_05565 [Actinomycetota bacterium]|nr:hypothetical protein [Actinomycetota bacterium]
MRRRTSLIAATALVAGALALAPVSPAGACSSGDVRAKMRSGNLEVVGLRTYHLEVRADKPSYRIGDVAKVNVLVTRPAHEDPVGGGIEQEPPQSFPAEGANVGIGLRIGDVFLFGHAVTNAEGKAQVKIKIKDYTPPGKAMADAYAWKVAADTTCARVEENGYTQKTNLFTLRRA